MKVFIGSVNPTKVEATKKGFDEYFDDFTLDCFDAASGVSNQPVGDEIFVGAKNRSQALIDLNGINKFEAEYFIGIESGIIKLQDFWFNVDCACIINGKQKINYGLSPAYCLDNTMTSRLLEGEELGSIIDDVYGTKNIKQNGGAISILSRGVVTRLDHCYQAVLMALLPFINKGTKLYKR